MRSLMLPPRLAISGRMGKVILYGLGLSVLCLVIVLFILSLSRPFMGVDIRLVDGVWKVHAVDPNGLAQAEGIKPGDVVTLVNGEDPTEFAATSDRLPLVGVETLSTTDVGNVSVYESDIPISTTTETVSFFFIGLVFIVTGVWVLFKRSDLTAARQLYLLCLVGCLACVGAGAYARDIVGTKHIQIATMAFLVPLFLRFSITFPKPKRLSIGGRDISGIIYLPAFIILVLYGLIGYETEAYYSWFRPLILPYVALGVLFGLGLLVHSYFSTTYSRIKQQSKIIMSGAMIGLLPAILLSVIPDSINGSPLVAPQFTIVGMIFIPISVAYAVVRHQLMDIDFYLRRTVVYAVILLALVAVYVLLTFILTQITDSLTETQRIAIIIALSCVAILMFPLVKERMQHRVDSTFYKDRYDYRQSLRSISATLSSTTDLDTLSSFIASSISDTLGLSGVCLLLRDQTGNLKLTQANGVFNGLEKLLELPQQVAALSDTDKFPDKAPPDLGVEFVVPLRSGEREVGVLCLGSKRYRGDFSVDDVYFVFTFATQAATAIENAILLDKTKADSIELRSMYQQLEEYTDSLGRSKEQLEQAYVAMATTLIVALEARDTYTRGHTERVVHLARGVGLAMKLSKVRLQLLELAGRFHDIGKINIPDSILLKPATLNPFEAATVQTHPQKATEMLRFLPMLQDALPIIEAHHEWYNGQGYPRGLKGKSIPLESRILAVVDSYDAMTSERAYRKAFSHEEAVAKLEEGAGTQWDPHVVEMFTNICRT